MNRRDRLMATLRGEPVDRPPVCFYELNGLDERPDDPDPFNVFSAPSWRPLIELTRDCTDRIVMRTVPFTEAPDPLAGVRRVETWMDGGRRMTRTTLRAGARTLTALERRDPDLNTTWHVEHLLKDADDLRAWLDLPPPGPAGRPDVSRVLETERQLGDAGIVMLGAADPLCQIAALFDMGTFTIVAMTEVALFHRALRRVAGAALARVEEAARALPGRLWRVVGPEYASPPYLPPSLFREYVTAYDTPIVDAIQRHGGFARMHCHGRLRAILDDIAATGCTGLDPIEPPPQGDVELAYVRERYGRQMTLFGNIEVSEIELLAPDLFEARVRRAVRDGTAGEGRGFCLMPTACPAGRLISERTLRNYRTMVNAVKEL